MKQQLSWDECSRAKEKEENRMVNRDLNMPSTRGGRREGAGAHPTTLKGLLKRLPPAQAEKIRQEIRRSALRMLIIWARTELGALE